MAVTAEPLLSLTELAQQLGRSRRTLDRLARAGEIPVVRIGRRYFFRLGDVEAWIRAHTVTPAPAHTPPSATRRSVRDELADFGLREEDGDAVNLT